MFNQSINAVPLYAMVPGTYVKNIKNRSAGCLFRKTRKIAILILLRKKEQYNVHQLYYLAYQIEQILFVFILAVICAVWYYIRILVLVHLI